MWSDNDVAKIEIFYPKKSRRHLLVTKRTTIAYLETKFQFLRTSFDKFKLKMVRNQLFFDIYRIVANASPSRFEAHVGLFRLLMKGIFDPYVL